MVRAERLRLHENWVFECKIKDKAEKRKENKWKNQGERGEREMNYT